MNNGFNCNDNEPPRQGTNLTQNPNTGITTFCNNPTTTTVRIDYPSIPLQAGNNYIVWIRYTDDNGFCNEIKDVPCEITTNQNSFTIHLPSNFPIIEENYISTFGSFKVWINIKLASSSSWEYWFHRVNGTPIYVLPVTFSNFSVVPQSYNEGSTYYIAKLNWSTSSESNTSHFDIQHSTTGANFVKVGEIKSLAGPSGESNSPLNYQFFHKTAIKGINYYRVKSVDFNGTLRYTDIKPLNLSSYNVKEPSKVNCNNIYIQGPNQICDQNGNYAISSLPNLSNGASWSLSPSYIGQILYSNGTSSIVNKNNSGNATLQATIDGCTDATKTKSVSIQMGQPAIYVSQDHTSYSSYSTTYWLSARNGNGVDLYCDWYEDNVYVGSGFSYYTTVSNYEPCKLYTAKYNSTCGQSQASTFLCFQTPPPGGGCNPYQYYTVSPVPASDVMTISPNRIEPCYLEYSARSTEIYSVQIYDMYGNLKRERRNVNLKSPQQIDVRNLPTGNYVLHLIDDKNKRFTRQIRIEKR
jgi:hypothetical protein